MAIKNENYAYCIGIKCNIKNHCARFLEGLNLHGRDFKFMQHCSEQYREGYVEAFNKH